MRLDDALQQLSEIHVQVLRSETYRGYRAAPTAATGALAIVAGIAQPLVLPAADAEGFAWYWLAVAAIACALFATDLTVRTLREGEPDSRQRTVLALRQLVPAIGVGAALTFALVETPVADLLPAVWAMCFGLGVSASRPFLPGGIGLVSTFYLCAGLALLAVPALRTQAAAPFGMAVTFGIGQLWAASVLHRAEGLLHGR